MKKLIICSDGTWDEPTGPAFDDVYLAESPRPAARGTARAGASTGCTAHAGA